MCARYQVSPNSLNERMLQSEYCLTEVAARLAWHLEELEWCKARETQLQVVSHSLMLLVNSFALACV